LLLLLATEHLRWSTCVRSFRSRLIRKGAKVFHDFRIHGLEHGQHLEANANPGVLRIAIGRITRKCELVTPEMSEHVRATGPKHRAKKIPVAGGEHAYPVEATTAQDPKQHRLRTVVCVVRRDDESSAELLRATSQLRVARLPSPSLYIAPVRKIDRSTGEGDPQAVRQLLRQIELTPRLGTKAMIHSVRKE
jgi:hypothetical protein